MSDVADSCDCTIWSVDAYLPVTVYAGVTVGPFTLAKVSGLNVRYCVDNKLSWGRSSCAQLGFRAGLAFCHTPSAV